jgi:hypothetical protein
MRRLGMMSVMFIAVLSLEAARGGGGGAGGAGGAAGGGGHSNAGGDVRGLERAEEVANPKGVEHGIDKAERKINKKHNPRNPNTQAQEDSDTKTRATSGRK